MRVDHKTKTELAVQVLRERIRTGELEPGRRVRLKDLTRELGMSPTPIREALRLLQADALVTYRPHQGMVVTKRSPAETVEVVRLRCVLEPLAVELVVPALSDSQRSELEHVHAQFLEAAAAGRATAATELNVVWHWRLYDLTGSLYLREFIRRLWDAYPWRTMWALPGRVDLSAREHEEIMEAIRAGDASLAAERLRVHIAAAGGSEGDLVDAGRAVEEAAGAGLQAS
jgi:DNA-binding GntR family transcriptional regulator